MEGRTFHRLAMIIALTEIFLSEYILSMYLVGVGDGFGVGCFEDTQHSRRCISKKNFSKDI